MGTALDGELFLGRGRFQQLMSIVRRQDKPEAEWRRVEYVVYDAPRAAGGIAARLEVARAALAAAAPVARLLEHEVARDAAHVRARHAAVEAQGGEGLMLRTPDAPHRGGRTSDLLKVCCGLATGLQKPRLVPTPNSPHSGCEPGPSSEPGAARALCFLLKVKSSLDLEALVTGHEPGKGRHALRVGSR